MYCPLQRVSLLVSVKEVTLIVLPAVINHSTKLSMYKILNLDDKTNYVRFGTRTVASSLIMCGECLIYLYIKCTHYL